MLDRRQSRVFIFQGVEGMRISGNDFLDPCPQNSFGVMRFDILKQHFLTEAPDLVAAVFLVLAQNSEILAGGAQQASGRPCDVLHTVIIRGNAVHKIQCLGFITVFKKLDITGFRKGFYPLRPFFLHLAPGIAPFFQSFEGFLKRLRHHPFIHHAPPQIHNLVDVFDKNRTFGLAGPAGGAGPDFILS